MDLSKYTFRVVECASLLDEIEPRLGVKFDRKGLFDHEQSLVDQSRSGPRITGVCWTFKFSKTGSHVHFFTSKEAKDGEIKECGCRNHVQITSRRLGYGTNALECALDYLRGGISKIQALRQPQQGKQMTPQDKETIMHETIARASLVAFAEFIGQPIGDLDATFRQARGLYGRVGSIACVAKVPVDKTKPIEVTAVDGGPIFDGCALNGDVVRASYYLGGSKASAFGACASALVRYATGAAEILATERAKLTPPPPNPEPIPCEAECRAHVKTLNAQLGINLNEDAVLAAGEAVRGAKDDAKTQHNVNYTLTIRKSDRAASFCAIIGDECESVNEKGFVVYSCNFIGCYNGLECALSKMESKIPKILKELTQQPSVSQHDMMTATERLDSALKVRLTQYVIYIFHTASGKIESTNRTTDADNFYAMLSSGQPRLYLAFKNKQDRSEGGRVTAHVSTKPLSESGFDVTISAEIVTSSPLDTISRLIESITKANL